MTHAEAVALITKQLEAKPTADIVAKCDYALDRGTNLRVRFRELPGGNFSWVIIEIKPETNDLQAIWNLELPFSECRVFYEFFKQTTMLESFFRQQLARALAGFAELRDRLGLTLDLWEEIGKVRNGDDRPKVR